MNIPSVFLFRDTSLHMIVEMNSVKLLLHMTQCNKLMLKACFTDVSA